MKTTIELPDELVAEAKAVAAQRRTTLTAMIEQALRREISDSRVCFLVDEDGLPVLLKTSDAAVTSDMVYRMMEDMGI